MDGSQAARSEVANATGPRSLAIRAFAALILSAAIALAGIVLNRHDISLVDTLDKHLGDWRIALGSPRAKEQRKDIAVVLVTEETLLDYESRSPIDRILIAELVRALDAAGAKVIALDFLFDRHSRHDSHLLAALRETRAPVVLTAIDRRIDAPPDTFAMQDAFLQKAGKPYGHVLLERKIGMMAASDGNVRSIAPPYENGPRAFAEVIAKATGSDRGPASRTISWLHPPSASEPLFVTLEVPRHAEGSLRPALAGLLPRSWLEYVKDRVVMVGASMVDRDRHATPLSVMDRTPTHGVFIQAQALAQILDGNRDIRVLPDGLTFLATMAVTFACLIVGLRQGINPRGSFYGILGLGLIGLASFAAFWLWRVDFPSIALATAWAGGGLAGFVCRWFFQKLGV